MDVAEMNLDRWQAHRADGIAQGHRSVRQAARIYQHPVGPIAGLVQCVNQCPFVVGLQYSQGRLVRLRVLS